ncbi:hypothetical protein [Paenibacillus harenae]|uniref:hypothetical protein n=1 Tax=Paenibacillus harenae TaxID=306543 RepID=UPI000429C141|nr:hypothetical protein [Paenibacillus harenae]
MTGLIALFVVFVAIGAFFLSKDKNGTGRDYFLFIAITLLGALLWGSLIQRRPIDINQLIGDILDRLV